MDGNKTSNDLNFPCRRSVKGTGNSNSDSLLHLPEFLERISKRNLIEEPQGEAIKHDV